MIQAGYEPCPPLVTDQPGVTQVGMFILDEKPAFFTMPNDPYPPGTHLRSPRSGYDHHAISQGWGYVIHFAGDASKNTETASIRIGTLEEFADGHPIFVVNHGSAALPTAEVLRRARSMVGLGRNSYSLLNRNCEHFALWASTGWWDSTQVRNGVGAGLLVLVGVAALSAASNARAR